MEKIFFKPWIGKYYEKGIHGKRILILGESHYDCYEETSTIECINIQLKGKETWRFFTNITITFLNKHPSLEDKYNFWHSVGFYNYIQESVGDGPRERPTKEMWDNAQSGFKELLQIYKPQAVIVLGYQLWENLPPEEIQGPFIEFSEQKETAIYQIDAGSQALAYAILHPSSGGFSGWYWHPFVMQAIKLA